MAFHPSNPTSNRLFVFDGSFYTSLSESEVREPINFKELDQSVVLTKVLEHSSSDFESVMIGVAPSDITPSLTLSMYNPFKFSDIFCFHGSVNIDTGSLDEEDLSKDELIDGLKDLYEELFKEWKKEHKKVKILTKEKDELKNSNDELRNSLTRLEVLLTKNDVELAKTKSKLDLAEATFKKLNTGTSKLDEVLKLNKPHKAGIGFQNSLDNITKNLFREDDKIIFVKEKRNEKVYSIKKSTKRKFICHYCNAHGHIKPFCYKLKNNLCKNRMSSPVLLNTSDNTSSQNEVLTTVLPNTRDNTLGQKIDIVHKNFFISNTSVKYDGVYTALKTNDAGSWYFDSGCSRHMTGNKSFLKDYESICGGLVTYGGGAKSAIFGKGTLDVPGFPKLSNVLHVHGLMANLISIGQLCDEDLEVKFNKNICEVFDHTNTCVMTGKMSSNMCYRVSGQETCNRAQVDDTTFCHLKLLDSVGRSRDAEVSDFRPDVSPSVGGSVITQMIAPEATLEVSPVAKSKIHENLNEVIHDQVKRHSLTFKTNHNMSYMIGGVNGSIHTRPYNYILTYVCMSTTYAMVRHSCFVFSLALMNVFETFKDDVWIHNLHVKLENFIYNDAWIRHHFLRVLVEKKNIQVKHIDTQYSIDITFTKFLNLCLI